MPQIKEIVSENTFDELNEEPTEITSQENDLSPETTSEKVNEEPLEISAGEKEEALEITSQKVNEEPLETTSGEKEEALEITPRVNVVLAKSMSQENEGPSEVALQVHEEPLEITSQEIKEPPEIASQEIEEPPPPPENTLQKTEKTSEITREIEEPSESASQKLEELPQLITLNTERNEEASEITSQPVNDQPSEIRSTNEEVSFDSSSDDVFEGLSESGSDEDDRESADFGSDEYEPETADLGPDELDQDQSNITSDQSVEDSSPNVASQKQCVEELRQWVETEAEFYGRTNTEFLLMFLLGCKMNLEKSKTKMTKYYQNRKNIPKSWADRDLNELEHLFQLRTLTILTDNDPDLPTVIVQKTARAPAIEFNIYMKMFIVYVEIALRRTNCQKNGLIWIMDCTDYPFWAMQKAPSPIAVYKFLYGLYVAMPIRLKGFHIFDFPLLGRAAWGLIKPLLSPKMKKRFLIYGSDLTALQNNVDQRLLPEEYGGQNGCLVDHEEACLKEVFSYYDYFLDDNKYGFQ